VWKEALVELFRAAGAVKSGDFTLASGKKSDVYVDARLVTLTGVGLRLICRAVHDVLAAHGLRPDSVGGPTIGADPVVGALLGRNPGWTGFLVRKGAKGHGTGKRVEGTAGRSPLLVEDTVTTGQSLADAAEAVAAKPCCAVAVVDRQEGAADLLWGRCGVPLYSLLTLSDLRS